MPVPSRLITSLDALVASDNTIWVTGAQVPEALLYATACISLNTETPGVFRGSQQDVENDIQTFYS